VSHHIKNIILSDEKMKKIFGNIMEKERYHWKKFGGNPEDIFKWLNNFLNKNEIYLALILADKILYYNINEVRYLWRLILTNRVKRYLFDDIFGNGYSGTPEDINNKFFEFIKNECIFIGFGEIYKSGQHMIYFFKQAVFDLIREKDINFMEYSNFLSTGIDLSDKKVIFLLDDFIGTGNQAVEEWKNKIINSNNYKNNPHIRYLYTALTGFSNGVNNIEKNTYMKVILGTQPMDDSFRCFSDSSLIYENSKERKEAEQIMKKAGSMLYEYPLGYENDQAAVAFHHNTPDNSLPVIWKKMTDGSWYPLFERFE